MSAPTIEAIVVRMPDGTEHRLTPAEARGLHLELARLLGLPTQVAAPYPVYVPALPWNPLQPTWVDQPPNYQHPIITCGASGHQQ